jgi:hypothetical protein
VRLRRCNGTSDHYGRAAKDGGVGDELEHDAILELDGAGEVAIGGKCKRPTALRAACVDGPLDGGGVQRDAVADDAGFRQLNSVVRLGADRRDGDEHEEESDPVVKHEGEFWG